MNNENSLVISKQDIINALALYNITDEQYITKCFECLDSILKNTTLIAKFNELYELLYFSGLDRAEIKKMWSAKKLQDLFEIECHPFITNLLLLSGYNLHMQNVNRYNLDNVQKDIHIKRVYESLTRDIYEKQLPGIRISQMLWGVYFTNVRIIQVGRLQYEQCNYNPIDETIHEKCVKIHIPKGDRLDIQEVEESLKNSKYYIKKYFNLDNHNYYCVSWLLSKELHEIVSETSNIYKFYNLFDITPSSSATSDILNFVFGSRDINEYNNLPENTSLQKKLKEMLISNKEINLGIGKVKQDYL